MEFHSIYHRNRLSKASSEKLQVLSKALSQISKSGFLNQTLKKRVSAIFLLFFGLFLSYIARESIIRHTLDQWEIHHGPTWETWNILLKSRNYYPLQELKKIHRILYSLKFSTDHHQAIWIDSTKNWMILFYNKKMSSIKSSSFPVDPSPHVFFRQSELRSQKDFPKNWAPLGKGWRALEKLQSFPLPLSYKKIQQKPSLPVRNSLLDPREIRY